MKFCPQCNKLCEFDGYFERYYCTGTRCDWRSEQVKETKTPLGELKVMINEGDFPGFDVLLDDEIVAKVEYDPVNKRIQTVSYKRDQDEPEAVVEY